MGIVFKKGSDADPGPYAGVLGASGTSLPTSLEKRQTNGHLGTQACSQATVFGL